MNLNERSELFCETADAHMHMLKVCNRCHEIFIRWSKEDTLELLAEFQKADAERTRAIEAYLKASTALKTPDPN